MKNVKLVVLSAVLVGSLTSLSAHAWWDRWGYWHPDYYFYWNLDGCSKQEKLSNLSKLDQVLDQISQQAEFQGAEKFQGQVHTVKAEKNVEKKIGAALSLVGLNSNDNGAVEQFINARQVSQQQLQAIQANTGLNEQQANQVFQQIQTAYAGHRE